MTKTILLAEDSQDDELFFRRILRASRVANPIQVVRDGDETVAYLKGQGDFADREKFPLPGVLFLDLKMPRMDGRRVLQWLKTQPDMGRMLVVVLTHLEQASELYDVYSLGAHSFLTKPITQEDMESLIRHFHGYWMRPSEGGSASSSPAAK